MKQGMKKRLAPKPKHDKKSWQKRNEARFPKQQAHAAGDTAFSRGEDVGPSARDFEPA